MCLAVIATRRLHTNCVYPLSCCVRTYCAGRKREQEVKPPGKLRRYVVTRYVRYLGKVENSFEKRYPRAYKVYRLFKDGVGDFFVDTKMYYSVATQLWSGESLSKFSFRQLDNYRKVPADMFRVAPVMLIAALPFANYVVFPVAYLFPRQLLCRHFWTAQQRVDFGVFYLRRRLHHYSSVLHYMERQAGNMRDGGQRGQLEELLRKIENKQQPSVEEIIASKEFFVSRPFGLDYLAKVHKIHMWHLAKGLGLSTLRYSRLLQDVRLLHHIDAALLRDGIGQLSLEELQQACFTRGLNAADMHRDQLADYLLQWTHLSRSVDEKSFSLLLHAPILLAYNAPSNAKYITLPDDPVDL